MVRPLNRRRGGHWWLPLLCGWSLTAAAMPAVDADHKLDDLPVRSALYAYYDNDPLLALTEIAAAAQRGTTVSNSDARLLEAGIRLGYGLDLSARKLLGELAASGTLKPQRLVTARLFLARSYLRRGDAEGAVALLADLEPQTPAQQGEWLYWRQQLAFAQGQPLPELPADMPRSVELPYLYYNQAVALANQGNDGAARDAFANARQALGQKASRGWNWAFWRSWFAPRPLPLSASEKAALSDQIALGEGQLALAGRDGKTAMTALAEVRQQGPASGEALLRYGLAAALADDERLAVSVWQQLAARDDLTPATLQVFLAMGWALEQRGRIDEALKAYEQAEQRYLLALGELQQQRQRLDGEALVKAVRHADPEQPLIDLPPLLQPWLTRNSSQALVAQIRDLDELGRLLQQRQRTLQALDEMVAARSSRHRDQAQRLAAMNLERKLSELRTAVAELEARQAAAVGDPRQLANASELAALERLKRSQATVARLAGDGRQPRYAARVKRLLGVVDWQLADQHSARLWQQRQQLTALQASLTELEATAARVSQLAAVAPGSSEFAARVSASGERLTAANQRYQQVNHAAAQALVTAVSDELEGQQQQVRALLAHARLAQARLAESRLDEEAAP